MELKIATYFENLFCTDAIKQWHLQSLRTYFETIVQIQVK